MTTRAGRFPIAYSAQAAEQFGEAKRKAEANPAGADAAAYDAFVKVVREVIADPELALMHKHMLRGDLAGIFRVKVGKRLRIFYLVSSSLRRSIVLMIGYRKEGDKNDAYAVCERLLRRGAFDVHFSELGVTKPKL